jgi:hypothetical protein
MREVRGRKCQCARFIPTKENSHYLLDNKYRNPKCSKKEKKVSRCRYTRYFAIQCYPAHHTLNSHQLCCSTSLAHLDTRIILEIQLSRDVCLPVGACILEGIGIGHRHRNIRLGLDKLHGQALGCMPCDVTVEEPAS